MSDHSARFAAELGSASIFVGVVAVVSGIIGVVTGLSFGPLIVINPGERDPYRIVALLGLVVGATLVAAGRALKRHRAWARSVIEATAWLALLAGLGAQALYLTAELPFDPAASREMQEARRLGIWLAIFGVVAWTVAFAWLLLRLRGRELRAILNQ